MPGFELIGQEEKANLNEIFETSNGVMFPHGFDALRNGRYRVREFEKKFSEKLGVKYSQAVTS
jgi:dTDP-4-amino-4,6-dideoxygalactose transaminase